MRQRAALRQGDELRVCPGREHCGAAEDVVTDGELADGCADCFDLSRQLGAEDPLLRSAEAKEEANEEWLSCTNAAVRPGDRRGVDLDEDLVLLGDGPLDVFESQDVRRPVPVVDNCSHESPFLFGFGCERRIGLLYFHIRPAR